MIFSSEVSYDSIVLVSCASCIYSLSVFWSHRFRICTYILVKHDVVSEMDLYFQDFCFGFAIREIRYIIALGFTVGFPRITRFQGRMHEFCHTIKKFFVGIKILFNVIYMFYLKKYNLLHSHFPYYNIGRFGKFYEYLNNIAYNTEKIDEMYFYFLVLHYKL